MYRVCLKMCSRIFLLVLACISTFMDIATAFCTTGEYEKEMKYHLERVMCSNLTDLNTAIIYGGPNVTDTMIYQSRIEHIPDRSFLRYAKSLVTLNMRDCGIREISDHAFDSLMYMTKLSLTYNNIKSVKVQWFVDLASLEQLDLSYNQIASIDSAVFENLRGLKLLDVSENLLTCLEPAQLVPMARLTKFRIFGNPLTFRCRGKLTLWLKDLGINYSTDQREEETFLDTILWLCAAYDGQVADSEILMKECVIQNLFNQLRTALTTPEFNPLSVPQECIDARKDLTKCVAADRRRGREVTTNGYVVRKLLRELMESKSTV